MGKLNEQQIKNRNRIVELLTAVRHTTNDIEKVADEILSLIESNQERGQVSQSQIAPPKSNYYGPNNTKREVMKSEKGTATITIERLDYYRECEKAIKSGYLFEEVKRWGDVTKYFYSTDKKEVIDEMLWIKDKKIRDLEAQIKELREKLEQKTTRKPWYKIWPI